jgi:hypothetical protein
MLEDKAITEAWPGRTDGENWPTLQINGSSRHTI